jgi:hypothetical protein
LARKFAGQAACECCTPRPKDLKGKGRHLQSLLNVMRVLREALVARAVAERCGGLSDEELADRLQVRPPAFHPPPRTAAPAG